MSKPPGAKPAPVAPGRDESPFGKLVLATLQRRSQWATKASGCRCAVTSKRNRGGLSRRGLEESAIGSEQESEADLDLTAGIRKVAVAAGWSGEGGIKAEARQVGRSPSRSASHGSIRSCDGACGYNPVCECLGSRNVRAIEQVEALTEHFEPVLFTEAKFLGDPEVDDLGSWKVEGVAADGVYALAPVGAVHAPTQSSGSVPGGDEGEGQTILYLIDRSNFPSAHQVVRPTTGLPGGFRNGTEDEAVGDVEVGVAILFVEIERVKKVVGVRESAFILAEIEGMGPSVIGIELQAAAHATIHLDTQRVVLGVDSTEDLGYGPEVGVRA